MGFVIKILSFFLIPLVAIAAEGGEGNKLQDVYDSYSKFDFGDSVNWSDCHEWDFSIGMDWCPPGFIYPPYPSPTLEYSYYDIVAMVEVVPDPWRSFLYEESFYDFTSKSETAIASNLGVTPSIGSGYGNNKNNAKEFQGQQKLETHVWALSDWWRLKTSDWKDGCFSLTCKNKDVTGCALSVMQVLSTMSGESTDVVSSINADTEGGPGQGQGIKSKSPNGNSQISYEDGSVFEEKDILDSDGDVVGKQWTMVRPAGNHGYGDVASSAKPSMNVSKENSLFPGVASASKHQNNLSGSLDKNNFSGNVTAQGDVTSEMGAGIGNGSPGGTGVGAGPQPNVIIQAGSGNTSLPSDTVSNNGSYGEKRSSLGVNEGKGSRLSETAQNVSDNAHGSGQGSEQQKIAYDVLNKVGDNLKAGSDALEEYMAKIDRIQYFNVVEQFTQMISKVSPIMAHPIFMTERHKDAAAEGGFIMKNLYSYFASKGAGLVMPVFCMSKFIEMTAEEGANALGVDLGSTMLGPIQDFINARCIGSWGPLEPRVTYLGTGDSMVAAGLAAVRGLDIAQNIAGDMYNKTINNTPFNELRFNLEWPHKSNCYGFKGFEGMSRGWTTPLNMSAVDDLAKKAAKGDLKEAGNVVAKNTVANVTKQGGYVFTFWRKRQCRYVIACNEWRGDTGL